MDLYDEEIRSKFIAGMEAAIIHLRAAVDRLEQARLAAIANDPVTAFGLHASVMEFLRDFVEQSKKDPKPEI